MDFLRKRVVDLKNSDRSQQQQQQYDQDFPIGPTIYLAPGQVKEDVHFMESKGSIDLSHLRFHAFDLHPHNHPINNNNNNNNNMIHNNNNNIVHINANNNNVNIHNNNPNNPNNPNNNNVVLHNNPKDIPTTTTTTTTTSSNSNNDNNNNNNSSSDPGDTTQDYGFAVESFLDIAVFEVPEHCTSQNCDLSKFGIGSLSHFGSSMSYLTLCEGSRLKLDPNLFRGHHTHLMIPFEGQMPDRIVQTKAARFHVPRDKHYEVLLANCHPRGKNLRVGGQVVFDLVASGDETIGDLTPLAIVVLVAVAVVVFGVLTVLAVRVNWGTRSDFERELYEYGQRERERERERSTTALQSQTQTQTQSNGRSENDYEYEQDDDEEEEDDDDDDEQDEESTEW
eukprot:CAMPEP_0172387178 /NCGR_PEP_ID=MMETSP1061-20121228/4539_1 /TAXON_ID=37318 /ORGANISM="Pseudo-nitzschia pungens, Strain cf. pungens" /LENGTH=393 /DNA_ID=CAMNT_0013116749 /DNA_START=263 /DNA_END=1441 /DNA_ORIENTATION=+